MGAQYAWLSILVNSLVHYILTEVVTGDQMKILYSPSPRFQRLFSKFSSFWLIEGTIIVRKNIWSHQTLDDHRLTMVITMVLGWVPLGREENHLLHGTN